MPLVQIIPYVADQFDPGLYVFDGGTFNGNAIFVEKTDRAFHLLKDQTFNIADTLKGSFEDLAIHVLNRSDFDKTGLFKARLAIFLTGVDWQQGYKHETTNFLIPEETTWLMNFSHVNADTTIFTQVVEEEVQNSLSQSPSVPIIIDSGTSTNRVTLADAGHTVSNSIIGIGSRTMAIESVKLVSNTSSLSIFKQNSLNTLIEGMASDQDTRPIIIQQREKRSSIDLSEMSSIISILTVSNVSVLDSPLEFTM